MQDKVKDKLDEMMEGASDPVVKFEKPFSFEGKEYTEIDLSAVGELSGARLAQLEKLFYKSGNQAPLVETSMAYSFFVAMSATNQPLNFFEELPAKEATKVKFAVMDFFNVIGIRPGEGKKVRSLAIRTAISVRTSVEYFMEMPVTDLFDIAEEIQEVLSEQNNI